MLGELGPGEREMPSRSFMGLGEEDLMGGKAGSGWFVAGCWVMLG